MFTAFGFSAQEGEKSDDVSKKVTSVVTGKSIEEIDKLEAEKGDDKVTANGIVRKCAHFSIYLLMGIFAYCNIFDVRKKRRAVHCNRACNMLNLCVERRDTSVFFGRTDSNGARRSA